MDNSSAMDNFTIPIQVFTPNLAIRFLRLAPSMGNSKEFALLASEDPSDKYEYTSGLVFVGSFILVSFFMWALVIILWRWLGQENVGLFSGHAMEPIKEEHKSSVGRYKIKLVRAIFGMAAVLWMVFVIVFLAEGLNGLDEAKAAYNESSTELNFVVGAVATAHSELLLQTDEATVMRDNVVSQLTSFCRIQSSINNESSSETRRTAQTKTPVQQDEDGEPTEEELASLFASLSTGQSETDAQTSAPTRAPLGDSSGSNPSAPVSPFDFTTTPVQNPTLDFPTAPNVNPTLGFPVATESDEVAPTLDSNFLTPSNDTSPVSNLTFSTESNQTLDLGAFGDSSGLFDNSTTDFANVVGLNSFAGDETLKGLILEAIFSLLMLDDFIGTELEEGTRGINTTMDVAEMLSATAESINPPNTLAFVFAVPWMLIPLIMFIVVVMAFRKRPNPSLLKNVSRFVVPLLCLLTMASTVLAVVMVTYAIANVDFCSGGKSRTPDETILEIAIAKGFSPDGFIFLATDFYVSQCEADYPYEFLETFERNLDAASTAISAVESAIALISMETIIAECGSDAEGINSLLSAMDSTIQTVGGEVDNVLSTLSCEAVVPSFTSTTYDIACGVSVNSVYYCYVSFIVMAFCGMLMITLRSAYLPVDGEEQEYLEWKAKREKELKERAAKRKAEAKAKRKALRAKKRAAKAEKKKKERGVEDVETGTVDDSDDTDDSDNKSDSDSDDDSDDDDDSDKDSDDDDDDDDDDSDKDSDSDDDKDSDKDSDSDDDKDSDKDSDDDDDSDKDSDSDDDKDSDKDSDSDDDKDSDKDSDSDDDKDSDKDSDSDDSDNDTTDSSE